MDNDTLKTSSAQRPRTRAFLLLFVSMFAAFFLLGLILDEFYLPHQHFTRSRSIEIPAGLGSRMIADKLKHEGFINSKWIFELYVILRGEASSLKPGAYEFDNASIAHIAQTLVKGNNQETIVTLPEGSTIADLALTLRNRGLKASAFEAFASRRAFPDLESAFPFLKEGTQISGLEGYLFPDTYHVFTNATDQDIANVFLQNFDKKVSPDIREDIRKNGKTLRDVIIMASLLEREVVSDKDRAIVSGILWKRLDRGIPLQVDATVLYAKKQQATTALAQRALTFKDVLVSKSANDKIIKAGGTVT